MKYTISIILSAVLLNACGNPIPAQIEVQVSHPQNKHAPKAPRPSRLVFSGAEEKPVIPEPFRPQEDPQPPSNKTEPMSQEAGPQTLEPEPVAQPQPASEPAQEQAAPEPPVFKPLIHLARYEIQAALPGCQDFSNVLLEHGHVILQMESDADSCFLINTNLIPALQGLELKKGRLVHVGKTQFKVLEVRV